MVKFIDTHTHLYSHQFHQDIDAVMKKSGLVLQKIFLPNIDSESIEPMLQLCDTWKDFAFPMIGLHPTSVKLESWEKEISICREYLDKYTFYGIGETGIDLYWDKSTYELQKKALEIQIEWALEKSLPLILHCRESLEETIAIIENKQNGNLKGIFHCFTGTAEQAKRIINNNFLLGIGGVVTFKSSQLPAVLKEIGFEKIVLETDSPYLAPVPFRGKRNESGYLPYIADFLAELFGVPLSEIAGVTNKNAETVFNF